MGACLSCLRGFTGDDDNEHTQVSLNGTSFMEPITDSDERLTKHRHY